MNITLKQLRAFIAVSRTGSFTLAAESLFITQSALSGLIKELEQALGLRLFDRSTRRIQLSEVGRNIYPLIDKILDDLDGVLDEVSKLKALRKGLVRIAAPQLMASTLLPEVIAAYGVAHPEIEIRLVDCAVESVVSRVFSGEVDFGVGPERDSNSEITATTLFELPFVAVFPPGHALAGQHEVSWADLAEHPLITLQGQFTERLAVDLGSAPRSRALEPHTSVAFMSTALSMVNAGLGVTICITYAASLVRLYRLEMRPLVDPQVTRRFYVFTRNNRSLSPAAQSFRDFLFRYVAEHAGFGE
ncbi:LysR family transcriptional regulator [Cognatazoarcus halotolerans]|uniref:LysR family transcriptional regulator n=1 Tax=Cognatazoarcus halotolerans TaxID=2686016 RepID=UPI00135B8519|nr:LysR family transcriptional regulator [Cognatazoarcus halotolerans]MCB1900601.1 LysR family transcriptional regulator [Rhodocyclaceae bacterium]MCP5310548.1 LysR family transcriptional regulator [Zoogloeaceae bacterium]